MNEGESASTHELREKEGANSRHSGVLVPAIRLQPTCPEPTIIPPPRNTLPRPHIPHINLGILTQREQLLALPLPRNPLDGHIHLDLAAHLPTIAHTTGTPIHQVDIPPPPTHSEHLSISRELKLLHPALSARGGAVGTSQPASEESTRRSHDLTGLQIVRHEEGAVARHEDGGTRGVVGGGGDGQFGNVQCLQERVLGAVNL